MELAITIPESLDLLPLASADALPGFARAEVIEMPERILVEDEVRVGERLLREERREVG